MKAIIKRSLVLIFIITAISCKDKEETKKTPEQNQNIPLNNKENNKPKFFYITLRAIFEKNDLIQIFYTQDQNEAFSDKQMLIQTVNGSQQIQDIIVEMPKEDFPYNFRLDLGTNKEQSSIVVDQLILHYGSEMFKIKAKDFPKYFKFNEGVVMNADSTSFTLKTFKSNNVDKYDPFILGNDEMINVLMIEL